MPFTRRSILSVVALRAGAVVALRAVAAVPLRGVAIVAASSLVPASARAADIASQGERAIGNPAQPRGGGVFLANTFASSFGQWSFTLPLTMTAADVSLTAFNPAGDSSEMSPRPQLLLPLVQR